MARWRIRWILFAALISFCLGITHGATQDEADPNRPPCTNERCRKIKSFLKAHYCGESPAGNGPDDGCEIKSPNKPGVEVVADYHCRWNQDGIRECQQNGQPLPTVRGILLDELHHLGLPAKAHGHTYFKMWKSAGWTVAEADYSDTQQSDLALCETIIAVNENAKPVVLRKLPFQKTDVDKPAVTEWTLIDVAELEGGDALDVILQADAYENHWLEVVGVRGGAAHTIFSGLGYYL